MPKTSEQMAREFERAEYAKRCDEVADLRRRLLETERAGEDIRNKNVNLIYERDRARELLAQTEARFNEVLANADAWKRLALFVACDTASVE